MFEQHERLYIQGFYLSIQKRIILLWIEFIIFAKIVLISEKSIYDLT
jgi:hypothetical protein